MKSTSNSDPRKWYQRRRPYWLKPPAFIKRMYPEDVVWSMPQHPDKIYLTFDDGPIPTVTQDVLDILRHFDVKATFFCIGDNVRKHPAVFERLQEEGHDIGNHSYNHMNGWKTNRYTYVSNVLKAGQIIESQLFRPPYGRISPLQAKILGKKFKIIMWSLLSGDFDPRLTAADCSQILQKGTKGGDIVVFHDSIKAKARLLHSLPYFIEEQLKKGRKFELLKNDL